MCRSSLARSLATKGRCKSAVGREMDATLASNQPIDSWKDDPKLQARIRGTRQLALPVPA